MDALPPALAPLGAREQFVTWIAAPHPEKPGKFNKFPTSWMTGDVVSAHDRSMWTSAAMALAMGPGQSRGYGAGAGFVFTDEDPYFFLDIDGALLPDGTWSPLANELCARLQGAAVEISHSGKGLHIIGRYRPPGTPHAIKNTPLGLELYTANRFVALTCAHTIGNADFDATDALALIIAQYFPPSVTGDFAGWTTEPVPEWAGPEDDDELVRRARISGQRSAAMAFAGEGKPTFEDLWSANPDVLGRAWPHEHRAFDNSNADMALANHLAFWTGKNCERMERLMRASALVRDKWDTHRSYMGDTILKACAFVGAVATSKASTPAPVLAPETPEAMAAAAQSTGRTLREMNREYMGAHDQLTHFDGCYFLLDAAKIFSLPRNSVMSKAAFDVAYGGHVFYLDPMNQTKTTSAWEAFSMSRVNVPVMVDDLCFRPELEPGAIVREGNRCMVNSYVPYDCPVAEGDVSPFLGLLAKMLPLETDRAILLNYMASMAQNPGRKFQWWPVLQGTVGNGKTLLVEAMTFIMGEMYSHLPNAAAMARDGLKFNGWIHRKLFIGVEEISLANRRDFLDEFKVVVTNRRMPLEKKGQEQITGDNRANGILCTNHPDGVPVTVDERRYAIFYTAQQRAEDLTRDGMGGDYFPKLYDWCREGGGFAIIAGYLKSFALTAALDPATLLMRAPRTSSTTAAIANSLGRAEQEIIEAVEEGRSGFAGGFVSSKYLDNLLDAIKAPVPRNKRRALMQALGYDWHPALEAGRTNDVVNPDASKPKLYLKSGHLAFNLTSPAEIAKAYSRAQEPGHVQQSAAAVAFGPKIG